jgi:hypothetical protein
MAHAIEGIWASFIGAEGRWIRERIGRINSTEITAVAIKPGRDSCPEEGDDKGAHASAKQKGEGGTGSGFGRNGPWVVLAVGRRLPPSLSLVGTEPTVPARKGL